MQNEPIYIVKYFCNNGDGYRYKTFETIKSAIDYCNVDLKNDRYQHYHITKKSIYKIVLDETNEIKELNLKEIK